MSSIVDKLTSVWESISNIPSKIGELLEEIFVPDTEDIKAQFDEMLTSIKNSFGIVGDGFTDMGESITEKPLENISSDYNISGVGSFNLTFFDSSFVKDAIDYFRPVLRGFIYIMLFFFNYRQLLSFIGQDPGMYARAFNNKGGDE